MDSDLERITSPGPGAMRPSRGQADEDAALAAREGGARGCSSAAGGAGGDGTAPTTGEGAGHCSSAHGPAGAGVSLREAAALSRPKDFAVPVLWKCNEFVVVDKPPDVRIDGNFDITVEKLLRRRYPDVEKFRIVHQLDYAAAFRERRTRKLYLALVYGHVARSGPPSPRSRGVGVFAAQRERIDAAATLREEDPGRAAELAAEGLQACWKCKGSGFKPTKQHPSRKRSATTSTATADTAEEPPRVRCPVCSGEGTTRKSARAKGAAPPKKPRVATGGGAAAAGGAGGRAAVGSEPDWAVPVGLCAPFDIEWPIAEVKGDFRMRLADTDHPGKECRSTMTVLAHGKCKGVAVSKVALQLHTGRRHQLRLHCAAIGHPIVGDATYGEDATAAVSAAERALPFERMMLHAWRLHIPGARSVGEGVGALTVEAPDTFAAI